MAPRMVIDFGCAGCNKPPMQRQKTIAHSFSIAGFGLHTGRRCRVTLRPAAPDTGIRIGKRGFAAPQPAVWKLWTVAKQSTAIDLGGVTVRTIEHMMAALSAFAVDNVEIEVDGDEVPIFDGSTRGWCRRLRRAGFASQEVPRRFIRLRKPVQASYAGGFVRMEPQDHVSLDVTHDLFTGFPVMRWSGTLDADRFERELAPARSCGDLHALFKLPFKPGPRQRSDRDPLPNEEDLALTAVTENGIWGEIWHQQQTPAYKAMPRLRGAMPWRAVPILGGFMLGGARFRDEPGRHVVVDLIGDLALAGAPLLGRIVAHNPAHMRNYAFLVTLMRDPDAWEWVEA